MISRYHLVRCDDCGDAASGSASGSLAAARREARLKHWTRVPRRSASHELGWYPGRDLCPRCARAWATLATDPKEVTP